MKISEAIKALEAAKRTFGDIELWTLDDDYGRSTSVEPWKPNVRKFTGVRPNAAKGKYFV